MNHPATSRRRAPLVAALAAGAAMLAAACSVASPSSPASDPAPTVSAGPVSAPPTSPSPTSAPPSPTAPPSPSNPLPAGWQSCANAHLGFEIAYPAAWHTAELNEQQVCQQFHPTAFTVPVDSEYPLTALNAVQTPEPFSAERSGTGDPMFVRTLLREPVTIGGRQAVRFEESDTGEGINPKDTMRYGYVIDHDGTEFLVYTIAAPGVSAGDYADWKAVVDQAVETLRFP